MKLRGLACLTALAVSACNPITEAPESLEETGSVSSAATATRIYATLGDHELSFETMGTFETRDGVRALVLHATANRYLSDAYSFVPDDIFGDTSVISERRLEVVLHEGYELNTVLSGLPLFVSVHTFTGTPTSYTARIVVAPRFFDFRGSSGILIDEAVNPYYVVNGIDNLSYRGKVDSAADSLTVTAPDGVPTVVRQDADTFRLDWTYTGVYQAIDPHTQALTFNAALTGGAPVQKTARLVARVTELELTTGDAYEVWPTPDCQLATYTCIHSQPAGATDFSACGSYRQVNRCMYASACEVSPSAPLSLTSISTEALEPAVEAWNDGSNNGAWHGLDAVHGYTTPLCPSTPATIQSVMAQVVFRSQSRYGVEDGVFTNRAGLSQSLLLTDNYYGDGAALLAAIDAFAGGGEVQAWLLHESVPCHNCHEFEEKAVLFYPATRKVIVLEGYTGYDS